MNERVLREILEEQASLRARISDLERQEVWSKSVRAYSVSIGMIRMFPGLVGLWTGSGINEGTKAMDLSGNGLHLTKNGGVFSSNFVLWPNLPHFSFSGTNGYLSHNDDNSLDITGSEALFAGSLRGVTLGGWWYFDDAAGGNVEFMMGKSSLSSEDTNYRLQRNTASNGGGAHISCGDGSTDYHLDSAIELTSDTWHFVAGRIDPSATLDLFTNGTWERTFSSPSAPIATNSDPFSIGAYAGSGGPSLFLDGRASFCFLCAADVPDAFIETFYQQSRWLFEQ